MKLWGFFFWSLKADFPPTMPGQASQLRPENLVRGGFTSIPDGVVMIATGSFGNGQLACLSHDRQRSLKKGNVELNSTVFFFFPA